MKILLVSHSFEENSRAAAYSPNTAYSLGLAYLTSFLEAKGHQVDVLWLDCFDFNYAHKTILSKIEKIKPDVLGIQMFTMNRVSSYRLIEDSSQRYPEIKIVVGGIHASAMPEQIAKKYKNVIVVVGEGEITFSELISCFEKDKNIEDIKGLVYWKDGRLIKTEERELIYDLDSLPFPKHEIYFDSEPKRTGAHIITSRGCPFNCSFCCLYLISRHRHRRRSVDNVIKEIVELKRKYSRLKTIQFHDDTFTLDNNRVIEFCKKIIPYKLDIRFSASGRIKPVSEEMLYYMEKAGFEKVMFGLETGAEKLMKNAHKAINKKDVEELFYKLRKRNFLIATFLMVGFPGEDENTVKETIGFVKKLQRIKYTHIAGVAKLWVYPRTEVYQIMKARGCISDDYWLSDKDVPYFTVEHNLKDLKKLENKLANNLCIARIFTFKGFFQHFLSMPLIILKSLIHNKYFLKVVIGETIKIYSPFLYTKLYKLYQKKLNKA